MRVCPKCSAYYGSDSSPFCLADGTPLVTVDPGSDNWSKGSQMIEQKNDALRKRQQRLKWRRVVMGAMFTATIVVCALVGPVLLWFTPNRCLPWWLLASEISSFLTGFIASSIVATLVALLWRRVSQ